MLVRSIERTALAVATLALAACRPDAAPTAPGSPPSPPRPILTPSSFQYVNGGFVEDPWGHWAVAINGLGDCYVVGDGSYSYGLTLTQSMIDHIAATVNGGGTVAVHLRTQHSFEGRGYVAYREELSFRVEGGTWRQTVWSDDAYDFGARQYIDREKRWLITSDDIAAMRVGRRLEVALEGEATAGQPNWGCDDEGARVTWTSEQLPVLRFTPYVAPPHLPDVDPLPPPLIL